MEDERKTEQSDRLPLEELGRIVDLVRDGGIGEIRVRRGELEISVKAAPEPAAPPPRERAPAETAGRKAEPGVPAGAAPEVVPGASPGLNGLHEVRSPLVGTFYRAAAPGEEPYVEIGDRVQAGQTLCIVEAMKLMNEIPADVSGEVVEVLAENAGGVEYDQPLFHLRPEE